MKFQRLNNGHGMCLKCLCDFFNCSDVAQNIKSKRKLNMDFFILTLNAPRLNMFQSMFHILLQIKVVFLKKLLLGYYWNQISCFYKLTGKFQKNEFRSFAFFTCTFFFMDDNVILDVSNPMI